MIAYISGHLDIHDDEFLEHYVPKIKDAIVKGHSFVVGDARGTDKFAQDFLGNFMAEDEVVVYHMFQKPRNNKPCFNTKGGFKSDEERDVAMTAASDYDIAWVRPGREKSGTAKNLARRTNAKPN